MKTSDLIYIAGHQGMVGTAITKALKNHGYKNIVSATLDQLDLRNSQAVDDFFQKQKPDYIFLAAARVGGIQANINSPADFLLDNLLIQNNIFQSCLKYEIKKLLFLGTSCIYPKECPQPMKEEFLLTGPLEPTNEGYALAKITGLKLAEYFYKQHGFKTVCPMPSNLYGPNDHFDPKNSHVLSALVKKFVDAKDSNAPTVVNWGTGIARREFFHVDDLARILVELMNTVDTPEIINIGSGTDMSIKELAELVAKLVGYTGSIEWDPSKPDGMLRKCLDVSKMKKLGLSSTISLETGISGVIAEYRKLKTITGAN